MPQARESKRFGCLPWLAVAVLGIFAFMAPMMIDAWKEKKALDNVAMQYSQALLKRDFQAAYAFTGPEFRAKVDFVQFRNVFIELEKEFGKLNTIEVAGASTEGHGKPMVWTGQSDMRFRFEKGDVQLLHAFRNDTGIWLLFGIKQL